MPQLQQSDRALHAAAQRLEEAWAWGLDPDLWRAHLGPLTWPEVLRQVAITAGQGGQRLQSRSGAGGGDTTGGAGGQAAADGRARAPKGAVGYEWEDVTEGRMGDAPLRLELPHRFTPGTWMAAAWTVLASAGPSGMSVSEVCARVCVCVCVQRGCLDVIIRANSLLLTPRVCTPPPKP